MSILHDIHSAGQSIWYDFISRNFVASGEMAGLVETGIRGMTSNPTIFEGAIANGAEYDPQIRALDAEGASTPEIATALFIDDITAACDVLAEVYNESNGADGYISLEVPPTLAHDTDGTVAEAIRLWRSVNRPNLMIKIPATEEGYPAIRRVIAEGINVNITLIFSGEQYRHVVDSYTGGLEDRVAQNLEIDRIHSVASVFISRIDAMIDAKLEEIGTEEARRLIGTAAIANARGIYREYGELFSSPRFKALAAKGANRQRPLWASTSTKNPNFPDLLYIDSLIGPETINTVPPATLTAILDHGKSDITLKNDDRSDLAILQKIEEAGVSISEVMDRLLTEGVEKFVASFTSLFEKIDEKRALVRDDT